MLSPLFLGADGGTLLVPLLCSLSIIDVAVVANIALLATYPHQFQKLSLFMN